MPKEKITEKMIGFYNGNVRDINHFMKVHAFAALLGKLEGLAEVEKWLDRLEQFRGNVFRTASGLRLLDSIFGER